MKSMSLSLNDVPVVQLLASKVMHVGKQICQICIHSTKNVPSVFGSIKHQGCASKCSRVGTRSNVYKGYCKATHAHASASPPAQRRASMENEFDSTVHSSRMSFA